MENKKKKNIIIGIVAFLIILVIFGLLYLWDTGWGSEAKYRREIKEAIYNEGMSELQGCSSDDSCRGYVDCVAEKFSKAIKKEYLEDTAKRLNAGESIEFIFEDTLDNEKVDGNELYSALSDCMIKNNFRDEDY